MIVSVTGKTSRIVSIVQQIQGVTDAAFSIDGANISNSEVVLLDHVSSNELEAYLNQYPGQRFVYINNVRNGLRFDYENLKELCSIKDIPFLVDQSDKALQEVVERYLFPGRYEGVPQPSFSMISCHRKSGSCSIAESLAEVIAENSTAHICIVKMDPYNVTSKGEGIYQLYREFDAGGLTPARVKEVAEKRADNLYFISGNPKIESARGFHPEKLEQVINHIENAFDLTLFIIYPYWDNTMTLVPLKRITKRYLVATSRKDDMKEFYSFVPQIKYQFDLDLRHNSFIYNLDGFGSESKMEVSNLLESGCVLSLPYMPGSNPMKKKFVQKGIEKLAHKVIADYGLPVTRVDKKKRGFLTAFN